MLNIIGDMPVYLLDQVILHSYMPLLQIQHPFQQIFNLLTGGGLAFCRRLGSDSQLPGALVVDRCEVLPSAAGARREDEGIGITHYSELFLKFRAFWCFCYKRY